MTTLNDEGEPEDGIRMAERKCPCCNGSGIERYSPSEERRMFSVRRWIMTVIAGVALGLTVHEATEKHAFIWTTWVIVVVTWACMISLWRDSYPSATPRDEAQ